MFKSILRFVGIIAFIGVFTSPAFAVNCVDRSSGNTRSAGSNEYVGGHNYCNTCRSESGFSDGSQYSDAVWSFVKTCGNGTLTCNNGAYKAHVGSDVYLCWPCPGISKEKQTDPNVYTSDVTWKNGTNCGAYSAATDDANGCSRRSHWTVINNDNSVFCQGIGGSTVPDRIDVLNSYTFQHGSTNTCAYSHRYESTSAAPGYRLNGTGAGNSCVACSAGTYSSGGTVTACYPCPWDAAIPTGNVTSPVGATNPSQCYYPGSSGASQTDSTGTYTYGGNCNFDSSTPGGYIMQATFTNCDDWTTLIAGSNGTYGACYNACVAMGNSGQALGDCTNMCLSFTAEICSLSDSNHSMTCSFSNDPEYYDNILPMYMAVMTNLPSSPNCSSTSINSWAD